MSGIEGSGIADFYERDVLPALFARLDDAFPEFAWRRDNRGWVARDEAFTHATLGVRAERVVCHGESPRGFLIHGVGPVLWTTYVNDGQHARGRDFVDAVRDLAGRAGVSAATLDQPKSRRSQREELLTEAFRLMQVELQDEGGTQARSYLSDNEAFQPRRSRNSD